MQLFLCEMYDIHMHVFELTKQSLTITMHGLGFLINLQIHITLLYCVIFVKFSLHKIVVFSFAAAGEEGRSIQKEHDGETCQLCSTFCDFS